LGCDLGVEGYEIHGRIIIHHLNPISSEDFKYVSKYLLNNIGTGVSSMPASSLHFFGDSRFTWTDMRGNTYDLRKLGK